MLQTGWCMVQFLAQARDFFFFSWKCLDRPHAFTAWTGRALLLLLNEFQWWKHYINKKYYKIKCKLQSCVTCLSIKTNLDGIMYSGSLFLRAARTSFCDVLPSATMYATRNLSQPSSPSTTTQPVLTMWSSNSAASTACRGYHQTNIQHLGPVSHVNASNVWHTTCEAL